MSIQNLCLDKREEELQQQYVNLPVNKTILYKTQQELLQHGEQHSNEAIRMAVGFIKAKDEEKKKQEEEFKNDLASVESLRRQLASENKRLKDDNAKLGNDLAACKSKLEVYESLEQIPESRSNRPRSPERGGQ